MRRAVPSLPSYEAYVVAREYRHRLATARQDTGQMRALDALLAFRPWESQESAARYEALLGPGSLVSPSTLADSSEISRRPDP